MSQQQDLNSTVERAFELADSGQYGSMELLRRQLVDEGYFLTFITGPTLIRQLREPIQASSKDHISKRHPLS